MMTTFQSINPNFQPETEIPCPCCHQMSMEKAFQQPLVPTKTGYWQYHCLNPQCAGYERTLPLAQFTATYGTQKAMKTEGSSDE